LCPGLDQRVPRPLLPVRSLLVSGVNENQQWIQSRPPQWAASFFSRAPTHLEVLDWKIGGGFYVKATLPNVAPENISGFKTKNDAIRWVQNDSTVWLHTRQDVIEKKEVAN
jgi:hypothetical protein